MHVFKCVINTVYKQLHQIIDDLFLHTHIMWKSVWKFSLCEGGWNRLNI